MFTPPSDMISEKAGMRILAKLDVANVGGGINTTPAFVQKNRPQAEAVRALIDLAALDFPQAQKLTEKDNTDLSLIDETQRLGFIDQLSKN